MSKPTVLDYVTCEFGRPGSWAAGKHTGIDYRAPVGTKIYSTRRGRVVHAGDGGSYGSAYGKYVVIESKYKGHSIQHLYAHLSKVNVKAGQKVSTAKVIGLSGDTGNTSGPHLHYEERYYPFGYYNYQRPVLVDWMPYGKIIRKKVLQRLGVKFKK